MEGRPQEGPPALPGQQASPLAPGMGELHAGFHGGATFAQHDTVHYASTPAAIPQVNSTAPQVSPATPQCVDPSLSSTSTASFQPHTSSGTTGSAHLSYLPPHPPNGSMYSGPPLHENPRGFASLPASPSPHPHAHSTMGSYGTPAMRPPDNYRSHGASPSVHGNGQCTTGSVPSPTPQPRMDASPYSLAPGPQVPRTPSQQAALFDAPNDSWTATVRFLGQQSSNLLVRLEKVEAKEAEMVVSLKYLQQQNQDLTARLLALEALQPSKTREEGWTTLRVKAKEHGVLKNKIHQMAWSMMGLKDKRGTTERSAEIIAQHHPLVDGQAFVTLEDGTREWHPAWTEPMNSPLNKKFIVAIAEQVYNNEKAHREQANANAPPGIPDGSFSLDIAKALAQQYIADLAVQYKEQQTATGREKASLKRKRGKERSVRGTKALNRRRMATLTEDMHGWEGAVGMVGTDFCSSEHTFDEENASDDSKQRRIKQGCGVGGRVVNARTWRRKAYVRFLRYLDHLLDLEARGRLTSLPAFVQLKSAITQSNLALQQGVEGQPPAKKVKLDDDTLKDLIRQGKGGGKRPKGAFHAAYTKGNPRAPVSKLLPTEGMVRKSWIEERRVKGESEIAMRKDPDFWRTCKITDDMLQPHDVALLAEVPDDSEEECNDGQTNDGQEQEE